MLTKEQKKWIAHLSDEDKVSIVPFDPTSKEKFQKVKHRVRGILGKSVSVEHHGATSLGISGQDEIDIYVPTLEKDFNQRVSEFETIFGKSRSHYLLERARFVTEGDGKHIDVFVINGESNGWNTMIKFESYLREHPDSLEAYRQLKEDCQGMSTRKYYRRKIEFINEILSSSN